MGDPSPSDMGPKNAATSIQFGQLLRQLRKAAGLTTRAIDKSTGTDLIRLTRTKISKVERGELPDQEWLRAFINACGIATGTRRYRAWETARAALANQGAAPGLTPRAPAAHWENAARGSDQSRGEFWFTGRAVALAALHAFSTRGLPGLAVVIGMPGGGKSAVLSALVLRSGWPERIPEDVRAAVPNCGIAVAVHAADKPTTQVMTEVLQGLGDNGGDLLDLAELTHRLADTTGIAEPKVVVIDAVDEAEIPDTLVAALVILSRYSTVLAGVRSAGPSSPGGMVDIPAVLRVCHPLVVDLDSDAYTESRDLATYVARRLCGDQRPNGYGSERGWTMAALVEIIGAEVEDNVARRNFLIAQFVVEELLTAPLIAAPQRGWSERMHWPGQLDEWIKRDVDRRLGKRSTRARTLLAPVAHARRGGLPLNLWRTLARAFTTDADIDNDIDWAIEHLGFYLAVVGEQPKRFAMRHDRFAGYFRRHVLRERREAIFVDVLLDEVPRRARDGRPDWSQAPEYTALNLLAHAEAAGRVGDVISRFPACLAAVDLLAAGAALAGDDDIRCRQAGVVIRRASYGAGGDFGSRCAVLQFHAALAGYSWLASELLVQAGPQLNWSTRWAAGGHNHGATAVGSSLRTQGVLPIVGDPPKMVTLRTDGVCVLRDAASHDPLGPELRIPLGDQDSPQWQAWEGFGGTTFITVGRSDGDVGIWALCGGAAGVHAWARRRTADPMVAMSVVSGPEGVLLLVTIGGTPQQLEVWPIRPGPRAQPTQEAPLVTAPCAGSRLLPLSAADGAGAFLTYDDGVLTSWRIPSTGEPQVSHHAIGAGDVRALDAVGDARAACVLYRDDESTHVMWLLNGLRSTGSAARLDDGAATSRFALVPLAGNRAVAAVADGYGATDFFEMTPDGAVKVGTANVGHPVYRIAFVGENGDLAAVADWSGGVRVVAARGFTERPKFVFQHGEPITQLHELGRNDEGPLVVTRSLTGLTRTWQVPAAAREPSPSVAHWSITGVTGAALEGQGLVFVAGRETSRVEGWFIVPLEGSSPGRLMLAHGEPVVAVQCREIAGGLWVAAAGESSLRLWQLSPELAAVREITVEVEQPDVEHLMLLAGHDGVPFVMTAGPESLRLWAIHGEALVQAREQVDEAVVDAAAHHWPNGGFTLVAGTDDGLIHVIESAPGATLTDRTLSHHLPITSVAIAASDRQYAIVAVDHHGQLASWALDRDGSAGTRAAAAQVPWMHSKAVGLAGPGGPFLLTATDAGRVFIWDVEDDATLTPTGQVSAPAGKLVHTASNGTTVAMAYSSGSVLFADPGRSQFAVAELNVSLSAFGHLPGHGWFLGANEETVVALEFMGHRP